MSRAPLPALALAQICQHLRHYTEPSFQRYIIRIVFMVGLQRGSRAGALVQRDNRRSMRIMVVHAGRDSLACTSGRGACQEGHCMSLDTAPGAQWWGGGDKCAGTQPLAALLGADGPSMPLATAGTLQVPCYSVASCLAVMYREYSIYYETPRDWCGLALGCTANFESLRQPHACFVDAQVPGWVGEGGQCYCQTGPLGLTG